MQFGLQSGPRQTQTGTTVGILVPETVVVSEISVLDQVTTAVAETRLEPASVADNVSTLIYEVAAVASVEIGTQPATPPKLPSAGEHTKKGVETGVLTPEMVGRLDDASVSVREEAGTHPGSPPKAPSAVTHPGMPVEVDESALEFGGFKADDGFRAGETVVQPSTPPNPRSTGERPEITVGVCAPTFEVDKTDGGISVPAEEGVLTHTIPPQKALVSAE